MNRQAAAYFAGLDRGSRDVRVHVESPKPIDAADAARLLDSLRKEAREHVLAAGDLDDNEIHGRYYVWLNPESVWMDSGKLIAYLKLNGREEKIEIPLDFDSTKQGVVEEAIKKFADALAWRLISRTTGALTKALNDCIILRHERKST